MKKLYPAALLAAFLLLAACKQTGVRRPLMGGEIRYDGKDIPVAAKTAAEGAESVHGRLEMPAPLTDRPEQLLHRVAYTVSYNKDTRLPNWVAWRLTAGHTTGPYKRKGVNFEEDTEVPEPRATHWDYYNSGYDRGHMCPSGDNRWDAKAQEQSFLFTNICPQNHQLNTGDWNEMEKQCRRWAEEYGELYIVCGPLLYASSKHKAIGRNRVVVPEAFFKVVLCMKDRPKAIGFIYKNAAGNRPKGDYVNTIDEVERLTGIDFFAALPDAIEERVEAEANLSDW